MNRAAADNQSAQSEEEGLEPTKEWVKDLIDEIIAEEFASPDLELHWLDEDDGDLETVLESRVKLGADAQRNARRTRPRSVRQRRRRSPDGAEVTGYVPIEEDSRSSIVQNSRQSYTVTQLGGGIRMRVFLALANLLIFGIVLTFVPAAARAQDTSFILRCNLNVITTVYNGAGINGAYQSKSSETSIEIDDIDLAANTWRIEGQGGGPNPIASVTPQELKLVDYTIGGTVALWTINRITGEYIFNRTEYSVLTKQTTQTQTTGSCSKVTNSGAQKF